MAFHFQKGRNEIDLAAVYHASLSSVEEVKSFQDMLLTGNVRSLRDSDTGVKEGVELAQLSGQYLHHCHNRLKEKIAAYEELIAKKQKDMVLLKQYQKTQERKKKRLKKTDAELDDRIRLLKALIEARGIPHSLPAQPTETQEN